MSSSPKGRLVLAAVRQFGARPFESVTVGELAREAEVTTGAIYHHFGSKLGLYDVVRTDVEQRLLDRMSGALAAGHRGTTAVRSALRVGLDFAVEQRFTELLGAAPPGEADRVADLLAGATSPVLGRLLAAAWRAALLAAATGTPVQDVRAALDALLREA